MQDDVGAYKARGDEVEVTLPAPTGRIDRDMEKSSYIEGTGLGLYAFERIRRALGGLDLNRRSGPIGPGRLDLVAPCIAWQVLLYLSDNLCATSAPLASHLCTTFDLETLKN